MTVYTHEEFMKAKGNDLLKKRKLKEKIDPQLLKQEQELAVLRKLREYPDILFSAYQTLEPYRLIDYLL